MSRASDREMRVRVASAAMMLASSVASGCSGETISGSGGAEIKCTTDLDCREAGPAGHCAAGVCTDSTAPPQSRLAGRGAVAEMITTPPGGPGCQAASAEFTAPANVDPVSGTHASLYCDLSLANGCAPSANVVVDGDNGATVKCSVTGGGDAFNVNANLASGDVAFSIQGTLGGIGGKAFVSSSHAQHNLQDSQCDVVIEPNKGEIKAGAIWAAFDCQAFGDVSTGQNGCRASGKFIFENCDK